MDYSAAIAAALSEQKDSATSDPTDTEVVETPEVETDEVEETSTAEEETEGDEPEEDSEEETSTPATLEVDDDTILQLPDGTTVSVKDGVELKAAFTKKTQELAREREALLAEHAENVQAATEIKEWYDNNSSNPALFVENLAAQGQLNKAELITRLIGTDEKATDLFTQVLIAAVQSKTLDDDFVRALGIQPVNVPAFSIKQRALEQDRLAAMEAKVARLNQPSSATKSQEEEAPEPEGQALDNEDQYNAWENQFQSIVSSEDLDLSEDEATELRGELLTYAAGLVEKTGDRKYLEDLELAYLRMSRDKSRKQVSKTQNTRAARKATQVVSKKSAATAGASAPPRARSLEEAVKLAFIEKNSAK